MIQKQDLLYLARQASFQGLYQRVSSFDGEPLAITCFTSISVVKALIARRLKELTIDDRKTFMYRLSQGQVGGCHTRPSNMGFIKEGQRLTICKAAYWISRFVIVPILDQLDLQQQNQDLSISQPFNQVRGTKPCM